MRRAFVVDRLPVRTTRIDWQLWFRWIFANVAGELMGLGLVAIAAAVFVLYIAESLGPSSHYAGAALMIAAGAFEGVVVGYFQANVLHDKLHSLMRRSWVMATTVGAIIAWTLGAVPSLVMSLRQPEAGSQAAEPSEFTVFLLAGTMGGVLGVVLAIPQWFVLRKYVQHALWWVPANALAWAVGMPQLFAGPSVIGEGFAAWQIAFVIFASIVSAGASVGAIHGLFLIWLLQKSEARNN